MGLRDEILEQPRPPSGCSTAPQSSRRSPPRSGRRRPAFVVIAARGSSDNAALYAQYLFGVRNSLVTALATPSTLTLYGAHPRMTGALVIGISQSGRSPDIVAVLDEGRHQERGHGRDNKNDPIAPGRRGRARIDLRAGPWSSPPPQRRPTRTELLAVALLSHALDDRRSEDERPELQRAPATHGNGARDGERGRRAGIASRHAERQRSIVLGRGYGYATAREWALKLQELAQVVGLPFSSADFEHGPLALAEPSCPSWWWRPAERRSTPSWPCSRDSKKSTARDILTLSADHSAQLLDDSLRRSAGHVAVAQPDRRDRARAALHLLPDEGARPQPRKPSNDPEGDQDDEGHKRRLRARGSPGRSRFARSWPEASEGKSRRSKSDIRKPTPRERVWAFAVSSDSQGRQQTRVARAPGSPG